MKLKFLMITLFFACSAIAQLVDKGELMDAIVARIDDETVMLSELRELQAGFAQQSQQYKLGQIPTLNVLLDKAIEQKILLAHAKKDTNIVVTDEEVKLQIERHFKRLAQQHGGEDKLASLILQSQGYGLSEFKKKQEETLRDQIFVQKMQMRLLGRFEPSKQQVEEFYSKYKDSLPNKGKSYKIAHIQVKVTSDSAVNHKAQTLMDSLIQELDKGAKFSDLAKKFSDDPTGEDGGDLGFTKKGSLDPEFEKAAFRLELSDYTRKPVRSRLGYHIIKVTGKKDNTVRTSHILKLVLPNAKDSLRAKEKAASLRDRSESGTPFADLAKEFSSDKASALNGGLLGWFEKSKMQSEYKDAVESLDKGQISEPVKINDSYHIFKLLDEQDSRTPTLSEDWDDVVQMSKNFLVAKKLEGYVTEWKKDIHIQTWPDLLK